MVGHEGSPRARTCSLEGGERRTRQAFAILGEDEEGDQEVAIALDTANIKMVLRVNGDGLGFRV